MNNAQLLHVFNKPNYRELIAKPKEDTTSDEPSMHDELCTIASEINSLKQDLIQITKKITTCQTKVLHLVVKTQTKIVQSFRRISKQGELPQPGGSPFYPTQIGRK